MPFSRPNFSGIRDNHARGSVAAFLRQHLKPGADLDLVTAYFTVFAYAGLRNELDALGRVRLLFGEAAFIKNVDPKGADPAAYVLREDGLALSAGLAQRHVAESCARWLKDKVEIRSVTLRERFKNWQVLLLTHDRAWYEIAKQQLDGWAHFELFSQRVGDYEQPLPRADHNHLYGLTPAEIKIVESASTEASPRQGSPAK